MEEGRSYCLYPTVSFCGETVTCSPHTVFISDNNNISTYTPECVHVSQSLKSCSVGLVQS